MDFDLTDYERDAEKYRELLSGLSESAVRGVLGNVLTAALVEPDAPVARCLFRQIENHAQCEQEMKDAERSFLSPG